MSLRKGDLVWVANVPEEDAESKFNGLACEVVQILERCYECNKPTCAVAFATTPKTMAWVLHQENLSHKPPDDQHQLTKFDPKIWSPRTSKE